MNHRRRVLGSALLAAACAFVLSGCLSLGVSTSVSPAGTFSGEMTLGFDRETVQEFGISDLSAAQQQLGAPDSAGENVSVQWSETETQYVQTVTFTDATPAQIEAATTSETEGGDDEGTFSTTTSAPFPLTAEPANGRMVVSLSDTAESAGSEVGVPPGQTTKATAKIARMLFGESAVSLEITMPGPITEVTGVIPDAAATNSRIVVAQPDPTRFEMSAPFVDLAVLSESADAGAGLVITSKIDASASEAPTESAIPTSSSAAAPTESTEASTGPGPAVLVAAAAGLIVVVLAGAVVLARRGGGSAGGSGTGTADHTPVADDDGDPGDRA